MSVPPAYRWCWYCGRPLAHEHDGVVVVVENVGLVRVHRICVVPATTPAPTARPAGYVEEDES
ncbi:MAG TPA: hypothetical protein PLV92_20995 [Pirellulaceae bacterium]|nr:hypothetical protein [Pirellulaceae bacterium]